MSDGDTVLVAAALLHSSSGGGGAVRERKGACTLCYAAKTACQGGHPCDRCFRSGRAHLCVERPIAEHYRVRQKRQRLEQAQQAQREGAPPNPAAAAHVPQPPFVPQQQLSSGVLATGDNLASTRLPYPSSAPFIFHVSPPPASVYPDYSAMLELADGSGQQQLPALSPTLFPPVSPIHAQATCTALSPSLHSMLQSSSASGQQQQQLQLSSREWYDQPLSPLLHQRRGQRHARRHVRALHLPHPATHRYQHHKTAGTRSTSLSGE